MFVEIESTARKTYGSTPFVSLRLSNQLHLSKEVLALKEMIVGNRYKILFDKSQNVIRIVPDSNGFLLSQYANGCVALGGGAMGLLQNGASRGRYFFIPGTKYDFKGEM